MKEKEKLTDAPCAGEVLCTVHQQPVLECANQRLRYVKMAREMDQRSMASARTWENVANVKIAEHSRCKEIVAAAREYAAMFCMTSCGMNETSDTFKGLQIKLRLAEALRLLDQPAPAHEIVER